jgi:GPI mannosyltransferase 3
MQPDETTSMPRYRQDDYCLSKAHRETSNHQLCVDDSSQGRCAVRDASSSPNLMDTKKNGITQPKPPKFHQIHVRELPKSAEEKERELMEHFKSHPFKARDPPQAPCYVDKEGISSASKVRVTIPESPKFHQIHARERPMSKEEKDAEFMEYYKLHPFKARDAPIIPCSGENSVSPSSSRPKPNATKPEPFRLRSEERAANNAKPVELPPKEANDLEECKKQFRARLMPSTMPRSTPGEIERRQALVLDEIKYSCNQFQPRPPGTSEQKMSQDSPAIVVTDILPFKLQSGYRHEAYQKQFQQRILQEEKERMEMTKFHARPVHSAATPSLSPRLTSTVARSLERARCAVADDDDLTHPSSFKARPLPKTTNETFSSPRLTLAATKRLERVRMTTAEKPTSEQLPFSKKTSVLEGQKTTMGLQEKGASRKQNATSHQKSHEGIHLSSVDGGHSGLASWSLFAMVCCIRVINTFLIQSYFDPDEFWQTMEPAYCEAFVEERPCPGFTWEWKRRAPASMGNLIEKSMWGPVRSYVSILPTYYFFRLIKVMAIDSHWLVSRGPLILNALLVAAPVDMAVWYTARWLPNPGSNFQRGLPAWCLFCSLTSWFNGYSLVRTFANSQETLFLILAVALVSPELVGNVNAKWELLRGCAAFLLGGLCTSIRFTALAAFMPMGIILGLRGQSILGKMSYLIAPCAFFGGLGLAVAMWIDYNFFGFWTIPFLGNFHFNVVLDNADLYGSHPFYWYFTSGLPAISGVLLPFLLWDFLRIRNAALSSYGQRNLWTIVLCYTFTMSFNGHKEFRFIHPVLPLVCLLCGQHVRTLSVGQVKGKARIIGVASPFVVMNLLVVMYLGLFHQSGSIKVNHAIVAASRQRYNEGSNIQSLLNHGTRTQLSYLVHYLTGACHSTPLHSSLHSPPLIFKTWSLDCSPKCRADPTTLCEAERFDTDPVRFVEESYFTNCSNENDNNDVSCSSVTALYPVPDYVVTFSRYAQQIQPQLESLGLRERARYPHHLNGAKIGDWVIGQDYGKEAFRKFAFFNDALEISLEEMILFSKV